MNSKCLKIEIKINENDNIWTVKKIYKNKMGINDNILFLFDGKIIEDDKSISFYKDNDIIAGIETFEPKNIKIIVIDTTNHREIIEINKNDYIRNVIEKIKDIRGIESEIILHYNIGILDENALPIISTYSLPVYFSNFFLWYSRKW